MNSVTMSILNLREEIIGVGVRDLTSNCLLSKLVCNRFDLSVLGPAMVPQWWACLTHDLVVVSSVPGWGIFSHLTSAEAWEKSIRWLRKEKLCEKARKHMCVTDSHDMTSAVKVALNHNTTNQLPGLGQISNSKEHADNKLDVAQLMDFLFGEVKIILENWQTKILSTPFFSRFFFFFSKSSGSS